jgi:hypothetical protein
LMLAAGYPKALIPFHVPNNIPFTSVSPGLITCLSSSYFKKVNK